MSRLYDVAILGGGPAGIATALALAQSSHSSVVLESSTYDRIRIGETLPPIARASLTTLGVWNRFVDSGHVPSVGNVSAWGEPKLRERHFIFTAYGSGWHLDRTRFDQMLASAAEQSGATVYRGARVTVCEPLATNGDWLVSFKLDGVSQVVRARFVVDATGRGAVHARRNGARRILYDRMIGVAGFFERSLDSVSNDSRTAIEASEFGWCYSAALPKGRLVAAFMTDVDLLPCGLARIREHWWRQLQASTYTRARVNNSALEKPLQIVTAATSRLDHIVGNRWLAVGDAALTFDPLSSRGIVTALQSGILAALAIERCGGGARDALADYEKSARQDFDDYLIRRTGEYRRERRWTNSSFWQRRQHSIEDSSSRLALRNFEAPIPPATDSHYGG